MNNWEHRVAETGILSMAREQQDFGGFQNQLHLFKFHIRSPPQDTHYSYNTQFNISQNINSAKKVSSCRRSRNQRLNSNRLQEIREAEDKEHFHGEQNKFTLDEQSDYIQNGDRMGIGMEEWEEEELFEKAEGRNRQLGGGYCCEGWGREDCPGVGAKTFIPVMSRRERVERYRSKKQQRVFKKQVSYHCRKIVTDGRLRFKGRFITKSIAEEILNKDISKLSNIQINTFLALEESR